MFSTKVLTIRSSELNHSFVSAVHSSSVYEHILSEMPKETLQSCFIGNYLDPDEDIVEVSCSYLFYLTSFEVIIFFLLFTAY